MSRRKAKNKKILIISITSFLLLFSVIGAIIYKMQFGEQVDSAGEQKQAQLEGTEEDSSDEGNEGEEENKTSNNESTKPSESSKPNESDSSSDSQSNGSDKSNQIDDNNTGSGYIEGQVAPSEPTYINGMIIANKKYPLPSTYNKGEDPVAKAALDKMLEAGKTAGYEYEAFSGFRSYEYQKTLYDRYVKRDGKEAADRYSARPGHSEHQTGFAFDIGEKSRQDLWLTAEFGETPAGQWLMNNAHHYGFILRYPLGKEDITGFMYESWHYRYVGVEHATAIFNAKTTLEEYLNVQ